MSFVFTTPKRGVGLGKFSDEYMGVSPNIINAGIQDSPHKEHNVVTKPEKAAERKKNNLKLSTTDHAAEKQHEWVTFRKKKQRKRSPK